MVYADINIGMPFIFVIIGEIYGEFVMKPIKENPSINMPTLSSNYVYSAYDTNAIKSGYQLINSFYSPLTNENVKDIFVLDKKTANNRMAQN